MIRRSCVAAVLAVGFASVVATAAFADTGYIDPIEKWAWSENTGWLNFRPTHEGRLVHEDHLTGFIWQENIGWIKLGAGSGPYANSSPTDWGVNRDASGILSGYAWSENVGWINFSPTHGGATIDPVTGEMDGFVWSENVGWIHLRNDTAGYGVRVVLLIVPALGAIGLLVALGWFGLKVLPSRRAYYTQLCPPR